MIKLAIFSILLVAGCNRIEEDLNARSEVSALVRGQIFVIRADRENVKLGGVELYYVSSKDFRERAKWIALNSDRTRHLRNYRR